MPIRVLAAVVQRQDKYLICQRPPAKRHGGLWEFPGGKIEAGESLFEAAKRELDEELGVRVSEVGPMLFSVIDPGSEFLIEFVPAAINGDPKPLEHSDVQWRTLVQLSSMTLAPSDRRFLDFLVSRQPAVPSE